MKKCTYCLSDATIARIARLADKPDQKKARIVTDAVTLLDEADRAIGGGGRVEIHTGDGQVRVPFLPSLAPRPAA